MLRWSRDEKETGLRAVIQVRDGRGYNLKDTETGKLYMSVFKDRTTGNWRFSVIKPGSQRNASSKKEWAEIEDALAAAKKWWVEVGSKI